MLTLADHASGSSLCRTLDNKFAKCRIIVCDAGIAQLVERNLAKVEVASSSLVSRSILF